MGLPNFGLSFCIRKGASFDLINGWDRKALSLASPDKSSEGLTGGVGRCDVRGIRYRLKQTNAENFDPS
jgi:hypothetical protein